MFLVCFSLVNRDSYENVQNKWMQEIRLSFVQIFSQISSTQRQLQNHLFFNLFLQMTRFEKMTIFSVLVQDQILSKYAFISFPKNKFPVKICLSLPPTKDNTLRIQRQSSLWEQKWTSGFESKSFGAVKLRLVLRRDDEDHIAEMEKYGKRPTEKWEVSEYRLPPQK